MAKKIKGKRISNNMLMWLSILLLIMIVEAVYVMKFQTQAAIEAQNLQSLELNVSP